MRWLPLLLLVACRGPEPLADCAGDLSGVWDAVAEPRPPGAPPGGIAFDVRDRRGHVELYPLWDTSVPPSGEKRDALVLAPWRLHLPRSGAAVSGALEQRFTVEGKTCTARGAARLSSCRGTRARLDVEVPTGCSGAPVPVVFELKRR